MTTLHIWCVRYLHTHQLEEVLEPVVAGDSVIVCRPKQGTKKRRRQHMYTPQYGPVNCSIAGV